MSSGVGGKEQCGHGPVRKRVGEQGKHGGLSAWGTVNLARQAPPSQGPRFITLMLVCA
jgi:hypothetical protein